MIRVGVSSSFTTSPDPSVNSQGPWGAFSFCPAVSSPSSMSLPQALSTSPAATRPTQVRMVVRMCPHSSSSETRRGDG